MWLRSLGTGLGAQSCPAITHAPALNAVAVTLSPTMYWNETGSGSVPAGPNFSFAFLRLTTTIQSPWPTAPVTVLLVDSVVTVNVHFGWAGLMA